MATRQRVYLLTIIVLLYDTDYYRSLWSAFKKLNYYDYYYYLSI